MSTFCNYWNKVSLVKSKIKKSKKIDSIGIGLASPEEIRRWGERQLPNGTLIGKVDKDHTVDYESLKPIEGGLFCERIFGPVEDFYCSCERKGEKNEKFCPTCEVEFTKSRVRRIRMGYIPLAVPVVHVWYLRGRPSYIANLVGKSRNSIDRLAYGETLSESFIGYSSLESIYKKEENVFPKRLHDNVKFNSAAELPLPHTPYPEGVKGSRVHFSGRSKESNYDDKDLITSSQDSAAELPTDPRKLLKNELAQRSSKGLNTSNISNGVLLNDGSLTHHTQAKSSIHPTPLTPSGSRERSVWGFISVGVPSQVTPPTLRWFLRNSLGTPGAVAREKNILHTPDPFGVKGSTQAKSTILHFSGASARLKLVNTTPHTPTGSTQATSSILHFSGPRPLNPSTKMNPHTLRSPRVHFSGGFGFISVGGMEMELRSTKMNNKELCKGLSSVPFQVHFSGAKLETTNLQLASHPFITAEKSLAGGSRAEKNQRSVGDISFGHKEKYLKCHTLPLFSTFVYKEWAHRFSFLEYFIWSARNNDLVLPFYAYQNSDCSKRFANICESIRKSSINLVRNKFSLRFSNKSNCNHSSLPQTPSGSRGLRSSATLRQKDSFLQIQDLACVDPVGVRGTSKGVASASKRVIAYKSSIDPSAVSKDLLMLAHSPLANKSILQEQKVQPHFLQLRNKEGILRVSKVKKDIGFLFHTKPNFYDIYSLPAQLNFVDPVGVRRGAPIPPTKMNPIPRRGKGSRGKACEAEGMQLPLQGFLQYPLQSKLRRDATRFTLVERNKGLRNCYAFSTIQQDTESTPLNKMDTQQFPRLTELLNFTGGAALRNLLSRFDLIVLSKFLRHELKNLELKVNSLLALKILTYSQGLLLGKLAKRRSKQIRRLKLLELFQSQKSNPEWMILSVIPVLPPDLRPILRVNDDFVVASDLNRLYQTVLRRNNTIHERLDDPLPCPESGLFRQRSLQKAVDGLLENGKGGGTPLCASKRRPLVSLSHVLKGKKGLFRQHLLGKRVDYSGRSVIVVGPRLQVHECGLPKEMAIELFQPFLLHRLKVKGLATSNTTARRMIQQGNPVIWHLLKQLIYEHPVLLNRAPTLHRLGIQAFQPRLVSGRAILLHPLVCNGFNADFDGDQMAVHVPLSFQARAEAWKIMWSKNNFLSPATGQPILVPSQDMVLGCYYLSVSIPRILNANVSIVSHDKAMTENNADELRVRMHSNTSVAELRTEGSFQWGDLPNQRALLRIPPTKMNPYPYGDCKAKLCTGSRVHFSGRSSSALLAKMQNKHISKLGISTANQNLHNKAFLNENKGQYFSNLQDSLLAYFQGRLQTHTPFWVRIDHKFARENIASNNSSSHAALFHFSGARSSATLDNSSLLRVSPTKMNPYPFGVKGSRVHFSGGSEAFTNTRKLRGVPNVQYADPLPLRGQGSVACGLMNKPNRNNLKALKLTFLQPLYGSSRQICKALFQNKSTNHFQIRVEANETLESPLELRLSVAGNLANILTMFQNHYNYNATWVKQCKEESIKYMRTTAGRVVINDVVFKDF